MNYFKETKQLIDERLEEIFKNELDKHPNELISNNIKDFIRLSKGGKRIRGLLVRLGSELTGKKDLAWLDIACAMEVMQTAILIHDDVIDNATTRRGEITIHAKYKELGLARSICMGDYGVFLAFKLIGNIEDKDIAADLYRILTNSIYNTVIGEILDVELPHSVNPTQEELNNIYINKTAWYTIIGPLLLGYALTKEDKLTEDIIDFGINLGTSFQIKDDIISISEQSAKKDLDSDVLEGKITEMYLYTKANTNDKLDGYGDKKATKEQIRLIKKTFKNNGSLAFAEKQANAFSDKATQALHKMDIDSEAKEVLHNLNRLLTTRKA